jgi:hypothetical protein
MPQTITVPDGALVPKDPSDSLVYTVDWDANVLATDVTIATSTFTITSLRPTGDTGLTKDNETILSGSRKTQLRLIGGTIGATYRIDNTIVTSETPTQTIERSFKVKISQR